MFGLLNSLFPRLKSSIFSFGTLLKFLVLATCFWGCQSKDSGSSGRSDVFEEKFFCVGDASAKNSIVYLHGFTDDGWSKREQSNLKNLRKIAARMDVRIAIPMSKRSCKIRGEQQRCWGVEMTRTQALETLKVTKRAASKCFEPDANYGVIGFSNGGYMATKIFGYCLAPRYAPKLDWIVTVGAAKLWGSGSRRSDLSTCRPITLVAGKKDKYNYERRQNRFRRLRRKGAKVSVLLFDGGHELPYGPLITALRKYLR
jgi:predicted esterase